MNGIVVPPSAPACAPLFGLLLGLSLGLVAGCEDSGACGSTRDCEIGEICADGACVPAPLDDRLDASVDAGPRDAGPADGGSDGGGIECGICGDLNGDGNVAGSDLSRFASLLMEGRPPTTCERDVGDVNRDGVLDERDVFLVRAIFLGEVTEPCADCSVMCGDANEDGAINSQDAIVAFNRLEDESALSGCEWAALDIDGNGRFDLADVRAISMVFLGTIAEPCAGCANVCGDMDGDGALGLSDVSRIATLADGEETPTACEHTTADADGDGELSLRDAQLVFISPSTGGTVSVPGVCTPCTRACGDVNDDESVDGTDSVALNRILSGTDTPTACDYVGADLKRDGVIDEADRQALIRSVLDPTLGACDVRCELTCGDLDGSEEVTSDDANRIAAHVEGTDPFDDVCALWAADVDADGDVDTADRDAVFDVAFGTTTVDDLGCAE